MYDKIYISLDGTWNEIKKEIDEYCFLLKEGNIEIIWNHFRIKKKFEDRKKFMVSVFSLELYLLINYLNNKWYDLSKIEIIKDKPMFIHNDDLYKIEDNIVKKINIDNVWFFSVRWRCWESPFFYILDKIITKRWWKVMKTNYINRNILWKWKFYALNSLYNKRKKYIWDIIIPYKIWPDLYNIFSYFLKEKLWWTIVMKKDSSQRGQWVYVVDLKNYNNIQKKKFKNVMSKHREFWKEVYIVPFKKFKEEYRCYFTKFDTNIKIFSIKKKRIISWVEEIINAENFEYYTNVKLEWSYVKNKDWDKDLLKISKKYIEELEFTTWALEFWKTEEWKLIFFEVNSMADPLCYEWEDIWNMTKYYESIFDSFVVK